MAQLSESERRRILTEGQRIAATQPTQRQTQMINSDLQEESGYEETPLKNSLHPSRWAALANRRVPWPQNMDPQMVLREMSSFMAYRFLGEQARAMGRTIQQAYNLHADDEI